MPQIMSLSDRSLIGKSLGLAAGIMVLDQVSKFWLIAWVEAQGGWAQVTGFFNLVMVWNRGISFGMLQSGETGRWLLVGFTSLVCIGLYIWLTRQSHLWPALALGAVIGGAVGNIVDRIWRGAVADFFDFHIMGYHWPAFNVADSAITIGVAVLLYDSFRAPADQGPAD
ncbi:MAG: signal peptidase II [Alphaproteobacteria bacterium]|nr:signal peptidase II [Alphaproteobacteria bacterium]